MNSSNESETENEEMENGSQILGNAGWADAMAKVLNSQAVRKKKVRILSKAKKESQLQLDRAKASSDIEVVTNDGKIESVQGKELKKRPLEATDKYPKKSKKEVWENMARQKPSVLEKDRERILIRIATKGVVQLFNAVKQQQKVLEKKVKKAGPSEVKCEKVYQSLSKGAFLDMLKGSGVHKEDKAKTTAPDRSSQEQWSILRDDFMMDATLKDWDKDEAIT